METVVHAFAKLNLTLDVLGKAADGYHDMLMLMQGSSLCDDLRVSVAKGGGVTISSGLPYVPSDGRNIAAKAARLFLRERGITGRSVDITVKKRIPVCAGLGGGSSDAAAVLRALNSLFGEGMTAAQLRGMAARLGSDVPYCVSLGTVRAEGRGDRLTRLPDMPDCHFVICKPAFPISTPALFRELDAREIAGRPDTGAAEAAVRAGDLKALGGRMANVFEQALGGKSAEIMRIKETLLSRGALGAVMSGTGSAVFGVYGGEDAAKNAAEELKTRYDEVFLCRPVKGLDF